MATQFNPARETATKCIRVFQSDSPHPLIVVQPKNPGIVPFLDALGNRRARFITKAIDQIVERIIYGFANIELRRVGFGTITHAPDIAKPYTTFLCRPVDKSTHLILDVLVTEADPVQETHHFVIASINQVPRIIYKSRARTIELLDKNAQKQYVSIVAASDDYLQKLDIEAAHKLETWEQSALGYEKLALDSLQQKVATELKKLLESASWPFSVSSLTQMRRHGLKLVQRNLPNFILSEPAFLNDEVLRVEFRVQGDLAFGRYLPVYTTDPAEIAAQIVARLSEFSIYVRRLDSLARTLDNLASS